MKKRVKNTTQMQACSKRDQRSADKPADAIRPGDTESKISVNIAMLNIINAIDLISQQKYNLWHRARWGGIFECTRKTFEYDDHMQTNRGHKNEAKDNGGLFNGKRIHVQFGNPPAFHLY